MSDERALAWSHLLPGDVRYVPLAGPEWWRTLLGVISAKDGTPVAVLWGDTPLDSWRGDPPTAVVAVNPCAETVDKLRAMNYPHVRSFAVLPGLSDARWFAPLGSPRLTAASLKLYTPYRWKARAAHTGVRVAARLGVLPWRQDIILIASRERSPIEHLTQDALGEEPAALAISTGTAGPTRKATLAALDRSARIRAICKIATSPLACRLVGNEAACLSEITRYPDLAAHAPRLLADQQIEGGRAIVVEGIQGRRAGARLSTLHLRLLSILASGPPQPATASCLLTDLPTRARTLQDRGIPVLQLWEWAVKTLDGLVLPRTIVHGDFAPWNLRVCRGTLMAFDWEYGQCDGLPLLDEMHHLVQVGFLVHDWSVTRALEELRRHAARGRPGLRREQIQALQAVYLLDAYLRRKEEGHPASDALLARQAEMITCVAFSIGLAVA